MTEETPRVVLDKVWREERLMPPKFQMGPAITKMAVSRIYKSTVTLTNTSRYTILERKGIGLSENEAKCNAAFGVLQFLASNEHVSLTTRNALKNYITKISASNEFQSGSIYDPLAVEHLMKDKRLAVMQGTNARDSLILKSCTAVSHGQAVVTLTDQTLVCTNSDISDPFRGKETIILAASNFIERSDEARSAAIKLRQIEWVFTATKFASRDSMNVRLAIFALKPNEYFWQTCHMHVTFRLMSQNAKEKSILVSKECKFMTANCEIFSEFQLTPLIENKDGPYGMYGDLCFVAKIWLDVPRGMRWPSRKITKIYSGLDNPQGSCHLNANLHLFFCLKIIRKSVMKLSSRYNDRSPIIIELQSLFYAMEQGHDDVVKTDKFLECEKSFHEGNESTKTFEYILAILKSGPQATKKTTEIFDSTIKIANNLQIETRKVTYISLQVDKGGKVDKALQQFFGGLAASEKVGFVEAPPVLCLDLNRLSLETHKSVNEPFKYSNSLDISKFLLIDSPRKTYTLFAVRVRVKKSGSHALIYINPELDGKWFQFNDQFVSVADRMEAVNANKGNMQCSDLDYLKFATFLVYVANSEKDHVFPADLP